MSTTGSVSGTTSSSSTTYSNGRYWGLATGLDVDSIVTGLVTDYQSKIDSANQQKQLLQWKQDAYNDIISKFNTFESAYLDLTNPDSCMLSGGTYNRYNSTVSGSDALSVSANADASPGTYDITIMQSAVTASLTGAKLSNPIVDTDSATLNSTLADPQAALSGKSFKMTVDGVTKQISFTDSDFGTGYTDLATLLNSKFTAAFGTAKVTATLSGSAGSQQLSIDSASGYSSTVAFASGTSGSDALASLGIASGSSNRLSLSSSVSSLFGGDTSSLSPDGNGDFNITINNTQIKLNTSDSISEAISKINGSGAGVAAKFSSTSNVLTLTSSQSGAAGTITLGTDAASTAVFAKLLGDPSGRQSVSGRDAVFSFDGGTTLMTRNSNDFTVDGVTYSINRKVDSATDATYTLTADTTSTKDSITKFLNAYNDLLDAIDTQVSTKPDKDYKPLTDTQKENMSDSDITTWNTKAKSGVLFNDSTLSKIADTLRSVVYQPVTTSDGKTMTLYSIGITTSYGEGGKLSITDLTKFNNALSQNPNGVTELFSKSSSVMFSIGGSNQQQRISEEGIAARIKDVIDDATQTTGVVKGSLVTLLGSSTASSSYSNTIYDQIKNINSQIETYTDQMTDKKNRLYSQFSNLEVLMEQMNTQSSWLSSSLGG